MHLMDSILLKNISLPEPSGGLRQADITIGDGRITGIAGILEEGLEGVEAVMAVHRSDLPSSAGHDPSNPFARAERC